MSKFTRKLQGNAQNGSFLVFIPPAIVKGLNLKKGDFFLIEDKDDKVILTPERRRK